ATGRAGLRVVLLRGEEYLSVRMYADLPSLWRGFSKNTFRFVRLSPVSGLITALSGLVIASCALSSRRPRHSATSAVTVLAPAVVLAPWYARFGVPRRYALAYPLAASAFQILALDSLRRTLLPGRTVWKGRRY
ncbi:MAG: hypothetical protein ACR2GA_05460, partial [Chloroflexota bacterium]